MNMSRLLACVFGGRKASDGQRRGPKLPGSIPRLDGTLEQPCLPRLNDRI